MLQGSSVCFFHHLLKSVSKRRARNEFELSVFLFTWKPVAMQTKCNIFIVMFVVMFLVTSFKFQWEILSIVRLFLKMIFEISKHFFKKVFLRSAHIFVIHFWNVLGLLDHSFLHNHITATLQLSQRLFFSEK